MATDATAAATIAPHPPPAGRRSVITAVKHANRRSAREDSVALRVAVATAALVAAHAVGNQGVGGSVQHAVVLAGLPCAHLFSYATRRWSGLWIKALIAMALLAATAWFVAALASIGGNAAAVQVPLAELFLWTMLFHAWDLPARRDLGFALVSGLVLIGTAGTLALSLAFAVDLVVWSLAAGIAIVVLHRRELATLPAPAPAPATTGTGGTASTRRRLEVVPAIGALVVVAVTAAVAFQVIPAAGGARAFTFPVSLPTSSRAAVPGGLSNPSLGRDDPAKVSSGSLAASGSGGGRASFGYFGFANQLDTAVRGRPDDTLVMRVRASGPAFWRGQSFDHWDGRTWTSTLASPRSLSSNGGPFAVGGLLSPAVRGDQFVQTYYIEKPGPNMIFAASDAEDLYFADSSVYQLADSSLRAGVLLERGAVYTVVSRPPSLDATDFAASGRYAPAAGLHPEYAARYLELPPSTTDRTRSLAAEITTGAATTLDRVNAIEAWLGRNTTYSLDIPPLPADADSVDHFLFDERVGFCEQIGTSLVVLLRSLGVPARLVVGYLPGERNPFTGLYEVKAADAHSWAEVYFPNIGWLPFDPTAQVPLAPGGGSHAAGHGSLKFVIARIPALPRWAPQALAGLAAAIAIACTAAGVVAARRRRRAARARTWAESWLAGVERLGRKRGRRRHPSESARRYVVALGLGDDERWLDAVSAVEQEVFGAGADPADRWCADGLLAAALAGDEPVLGRR